MHNHHAARSIGVIGIFEAQPALARRGSVLAASNKSNGV